MRKMINAPLVRVLMMNFLVATLVLSIPNTDFLVSCKCNFGDGVAVPQNKTQIESGDVTCTPPAIVGFGEVSLDLPLLSSSVYYDAQIFSYHPKLKAPPTIPNVTVSLIALGADGCTAIRGQGGKMISAEECLNISVSYITKAALLGADLVVLPENWPMQHVNLTSMNPPAQPLNGPIIQKITSLARDLHVNIVAPIRELRNQTKYNTAVIINRNGTVLGTYSKVMPVWGNMERTEGEIFGVSPSQEGVKYFDMDFGRMAVLICYDINFPELWQQAEALASDLIVWPSAMRTPDPFSYGYARIHQTHIVAVGTPGDVIDMTGEQHQTHVVEGFPYMKVAHLNLNRVYVHWDYNTAKVQQLLQDYGANGTVSLELEGPPFYLLRSNDPLMNLRSLLVSYGIETAREYAYRSRRGLNFMRQLTDT